MDASAPGWWGRYRFYTAGKVPKGHEGWALERMSLTRWIAVLLVVDAVGIAVVFTAWVAVTGHLDLPVAPWVFPAVSLVFAPLSAMSYRKRALRALAPPPAHEVLKDVREPVPPRH